MKNQVRFPEPKYKPKKPLSDFEQMRFNNPVLYYLFPANFYTLISLFFYFAVLFTFPWEVLSTINGFREFIDGFAGLFPSISDIASKQAEGERIKAAMVFMYLVWSVILLIVTPLIKANRRLLNNPNLVGGVRTASLIGVFVVSVCLLLLVMLDVPEGSKMLRRSIWRRNMMLDFYGATIVFSFLWSAFIFSYCVTISVIKCNFHKK